MTIIWFTGLSGSGKSTIAQHVGRILYDQGQKVQLLDGDDMRTNLCKDLGFSKEDRIENVRRISYVANMLAGNGIIVLAPAIAPYRISRQLARGSAEAQGIRFVEVYVNAPLALCEDRDPKGLYKRARAGEIQSFTGLSDPYEVPSDPDIVCHTDTDSVECSAEQVMQYWSSRYYARFAGAHNGDYPTTLGRDGDAI